MTVSRKRLDELENIPESATDTSDIPELDASFWLTKEELQNQIQMSKVNEFQKVYEDIESEVSYVYPSDTISSFRLLVDEMIEEFIKLESERDRLVLTLKFVQIDLTNANSIDKALTIISKQLEELNK